MLLIIPGVVQRRVSLLVIGAFFVNIAVLSTLLERQTSQQQQQQQQQQLPVVRHHDHEQRDPLFLLNRNRFPLYGTPAFQQICPWAGVQTQPQPQPQIQRTQLRDSSSLPNCENCTIFAPPPDDMEGISSWIARVVSGYIMAKQTGCSLIIHYWEGISISDMFIPILDDDHHDEDDRHGSGRSSISRWNDWRMPPNFTCQQNCYVAEFAYPQGGGPGFRKKGCTKIRGPLAAVPAFRTPYLASFVKQGTGLNTTLPGFTIETSMACAFGSMFRLSPKVATYQPNIFTNILPALQDDPTVGLVLSLYIRTGHTEQITHPEWIDRYRAQAESIVQCALHVEALQQQQQHDENSKVVWMLVTDSPYVKTFVTETYSSLVGPNRTILTTQSRGAHTKPKGQPSTADFVEGFLDWYLIGESDIVISDNAGPSFGNTASFRTARPHYKVPNDNQQGRGGGRSVMVCSKVEPSLEYVHR